MNLLVRSALDTRMKPSVWKGEAFRFAEHKLDGIRLTVVRDLDGVFYAIGRKTYINHAGVLRRSGRFEELFGIPPGTALDGELHGVDGTQSSDVASLLSSGGALEFTPFAVPFLEGRRLAGGDTYPAQRERIQDLGLRPPVLVEFDCPKPQLREEMLGYIQHRKLEGLVLKADPFFAWWKLKPVKTVDAVISNYSEGTSRNAGRLGNLFVYVHDPSLGASVEIARVGTGFSDELRDRLWAERDGLKGRVVEIAYDSVAAGGRLRFPRFVRFRDDKPGAECTFDQLER